MNLDIDKNKPTSIFKKLNLRFSPTAVGPVNDLKPALQLAVQGISAQVLLSPLSDPRLIPRNNAKK